LTATNSFFPNVSFDPETVNLLSDAFETAWQRVQTSGNRLARPGYAKVMREVMARQIINLAQHGERDETELSDSADPFFYRELQDIGRVSGGRIIWFCQLRNAEIAGASVAMFAVTVL
jgi:hypothetical protein